MNYHVAELRVKMKLVLVKETIVSVFWKTYKLMKTTMKDLQGSTLTWDAYFLAFA